MNNIQIKYNIQENSKYAINVIYYIIYMYDCIV
jgi:hypothetical protein